ncbi:hypothetical protein C3402_21715 [Pantoea sp. PSNIH3]|nr:hypothetical protein C3402_21715 [Pantoea sp. PSNIH3]
MVVLVGLAIDQIAQSGLSSLSVIYYSAHLFSGERRKINVKADSLTLYQPGETASGDVPG